MEYFKGNLQKSNNNYEKSLILLDYQIYNWDTVGDENSARQNLKYSYDELKEVLYKNYLTFCKREKGNFIIFNKQKELYVSRFVKNGCYLVPKENAKVFPSKEDAQIALQNFDISKYGKYLNYLESEIWLNLKNKIKKRDKNKCTKCNSNLNLQVHHLTYENLFNEKDEDLITLCSKCHKDFHKDDHKKFL